MPGDNLGEGRGRGVPDHGEEWGTDVERAVQVVPNRVADFRRMFTEIVGADRRATGMRSPGKVLKALYKLCENLERAKGFEPSTPTLARSG